MRKNTKKALSRLLIGILWMSLLGTPLAEGSQVVYAAEVSGVDVSGNDNDNPGDTGDISGNDSDNPGDAGDISGNDGDRPGDTGDVFGNDSSAGDVSGGDILPVSVAEGAVRVEMNGESLDFSTWEKAAAYVSHKGSR